MLLSLTQPWIWCRRIWFYCQTERNTCTHFHLIFRIYIISVLEMWHFWISTAQWIHKPSRNIIFMLESNCPKIVISQESFRFPFFGGFIRCLSSIACDSSANRVLGPIHSIKLKDQTELVYAWQHVDTNSFHLDIVCKMKLTECETANKRSDYSISIYPDKPHSVFYLSKNADMVGHNKNSAESFIDMWIIEHEWKPTTTIFPMW